MIVIKYSVDFTISKSVATDSTKNRRFVVVCPNKESALVLLDILRNVPELTNINGWREETDFTLVG